MTAVGSAALALQPAFLTVINPSGQRSRVLLNQSPFLIGRQSGNQLVLRDNRVSRVHAQITAESAGYAIEDLNSRHGLYVNGERIQGKHTLFHSDSISFGFPDGYQLIFLQEEREIGRLVDHVASTSKSVGGVGSNLAKLRALVEVARALQSSLSIQEVLESVVEAALIVTGCERGFLLLRGHSSLKVEVARDNHGAAIPPERLGVPTQLIARALDSRRELLSMHFDPTLEGATDPDTSIARLDLRSVVCVPLVRIKTEISANTIISPVNETVGLIYLDSRSDLADLSSGNRELLQTLALEASTVLENARLLEQERAKQRLDEELRIARGIQQGLLPRTLPTSGWFTVAGASISSQQVGGDYYDVAQTAPGVWALVVADVSGKGVSSALLAALLQGAFLVGAGTAEAIQGMLAHINQYLYERTEGEKYATVFYCAVHRDGTIHWANAGHCPPILLHRDGTMEAWRPTSMPVGILDVATFPVRTSRLLPGDRLVIYSDGISEAQNIHGEYFEHARINRLLKEGATLGAAALHARILQEVGQFTGGVAQADDMTLVIAEYNPEDAPTPLKRELLAEFLGTFVLILFGNGVVAQTVLFPDKGSFTNINIAWGLGVVFGIYVAGRISGAHLNPAVTLALAAFNGFSWRKVLPYSLAQTAGAFSAAALVFLTYRKAFDKVDPLLERTAGIFATFPALPASPATGFLDQIVGTAILVLLVMVLIDNRNQPLAGLNPILIGLIVVAIGMAFGSLHGYAINPARDLGPRLLTVLAGFPNNGLTDGSGAFLIPLLGPLAGALLGGLLYQRALR